MSEDERAGDCRQMSRRCGSIMRSRMTTPRGRVSMKRIAAATSSGCITLPEASASSIFAFGQSSRSAVTNGRGRMAVVRVFGTTELTEEWRALAHLVQAMPLGGDGSSGGFWC